MTEPLDTDAINRFKSYHDTLLLGKTGAMIYVLGSDGHALSGGHHFVEWRGRDDFLGTTGARERGFSVDTSNSNIEDILPGDSLARQITLDDIIEGARDERIAALARYLKLYDDGDIPTQSVESASRKP